MPTKKKATMTHNDNHPPPAWMKVNPIFREREFISDKSLVFVLMPFSENWSDRVWDVVASTVTKVGMRAERADNRHGPIVTEDIWRGIVECRVVLADVTGQNPNVFYELGIAHTLGKDVVLQSQPLARLPFDTQGFRHIIYSDNPAGMRWLESEIPAKISHFIAKDRVTQEPITKANAAKQAAVAAQALRDAWLSVAEGWDPPLPALTHKDRRSDAGALRKRMREYVYGLPEADAKRLASEIREIWPSDFGDEPNIGVVKDVLEKTEQVLSKWRAIYSEHRMR